MAQYSYPHSIQERRVALRRGINTLVYFVASLLALAGFWTAVLWFPAAFWARLALGLGLAAGIFLVVRRAVDPLYGVAAIPSIARYIHLESNERALISFLEDAEAWYREAQSALSDAPLGGPRLLRQLPTFVARCGDLQADDFLEREAAIRSAISGRRSFISDRRSCVLAAEYYLRYLKRPQHLDFDWDYEDAESLGMFFYRFHTWELDALHVAKRKLARSEVSPEDPVEDAIGVFEAACQAVREMHLAERDQIEGVRKLEAEELARRAGDPAAQETIRVVARQMVSDIRRMGQRARSEMFREEGV